MNSAIHRTSTAAFSDRRGQIRLGTQSPTLSRKLTISNAMPLTDVKITVFSSQQYVRDFMTDTMLETFPATKFVEPALDPVTAALAYGSDVAVLFVNDPAPAEVVHALADNGVKMLALRCAGFDRVDLEACAQRGIKVARVPTYSPQSVAEHAVALMFTLNRQLHNAHQRVLQGNYALSGLVGRQMFGKTVGVVGTGAIGVESVRILRGIGCKVLAYDVRPNPAALELGAVYLPLDELLPQCDIITLHCPLLPSTFHLINKDKINMMKPGTMLINTSRGGLIDSDALFDGLESNQIGALGLDVYENEGKLFFTDFTVYESSQRMKDWDRRLRTLLTYPNVIITPHSAFLTKEALYNIAETTIENISNWATDKDLGINEVKPLPAK